MNTSADQIAAHLIRTCHHIAELSNLTLTRDHTRALRLSLAKAQRLIDALEGPEGSNVVSLHPLSADLAQTRS